MKPIISVGLVLTAALALEGCSVFGGDPKVQAATPPPPPKEAPVVVAMAPDIVGPLVPGGPPLPVQRPTATAGSTAAVPPKPVVAASVPMPPGSPPPATVVAMVVPPPAATGVAKKPSTDIDADLLAPTICRKPPEMAADEIRRLQTTLLIATLRCQRAPEVREAITANYNQYMKSYGGEMLTQTNVLQGLFKRQFGAGRDLKQFDLYVTALANEFSQNSMVDPMSYCTSALAALEDLNKLKPKDLGNYSHTSPIVQRSKVAKGC